MRQEKGNNNVTNTLIDFSNVKELAAVPAGEYTVTFTKAEIKSGPKAKYISAEFTITDEDDENNGRKLYRNLSLSENSLWAVKQFMLAAGANEDIFAGEMDLEEELDNLIGNEVVVITSTREYEGVLRAQVDRIKAPSF